jgi:hypothetical protein
MFFPFFFLIGVKEMQTNGSGKYLLAAALYKSH